MTSSSQKFWFVAYVKSCCERKLAEFLGSRGYECFVPIRQEVHRWSDRKKLVERVLLPHMVFVYCTEAQRVASLVDNPYINAYMYDRGESRAAVVRQEALDAFRAFISQSEREMNKVETFVPGDRVRVLSGPFEGHEMEVVSVDSRTCYISRLGPAGTFVVAVESDILRKMQN